MSNKCTMQQFVPRHMHMHMGKRFDNKYVAATMSHPPSRMIWGAMSYRGAAGLYFIPPNTTMNRPIYMELLKEKAKLHMHDLHARGRSFFTNVANEFLKRNKISVLEWPGTALIAIQSRTCGLL